MNLLIIIGAFFTIFTPMGAASGYLLMLLGLINQRPLRETKLATKLIVLLTVLELAKTFLPLPDLLYMALVNLSTALPIYLFYLLIKAEYMWSPRRQTANFLKRYSTIGTVYLLNVMATIWLDSLLIMRLVISSTYYTYLFYIFVTLYVRNPNRKRLELPRKFLSKR